MKRKRHIINLVLVINIVGALAFTASAYVFCGNNESDEFLDIAQVYQNPNNPILTLHLNNTPLNSLLPKLLHLKIKPFAEVLRC